MTLKEFAEQNPALIEKASACKTKEEFAKFANENGIDLSESLDAAYAYLKGSTEGELNEDTLENVAGGKSKYLETTTANVYTNKDGKVIVKK